jgi:hypothetical protein
VARIFIQNDNKTIVEMKKVRVPFVIVL